MQWTMHWTIVCQVFMIVIIVKACQVQKMCSEGCSVRKSYKHTCTKKQGKEQTSNEAQPTKGVQREAGAKTNKPKTIELN